jgi:hypothetical protein
MRRGLPGILGLHLQHLIQHLLQQPRHAAIAHQQVLDNIVPQGNLVLSH